MKSPSLEIARREIEKLRLAIEEHNYRYHVLDSPTISDAEFDALFEKLRNLESEFPQLKDPHSPTQKVGGPPIVKFQKVAHRVPMLGLQNVYHKEGMSEWLERWKKEIPDKTWEFCLEPKLDGLSIEITYEHGKLIRAVTRGNGEVGEDVTENVKTIATVPLNLRKGAPPILEARGEILLLKKDFEKLNTERAKLGEPLFASPRNVAAGSIRQLDPKVAAARSLDIYFYGVGYAEWGDDKVATQENLMDRFRNLGLKVNPLFTLGTTLQDIEDYYHKLSTLRKSLPYEIDGVVIKLNSEKLQRRLGSIARAPKWAVAYKFVAQEAISRLLSVQFQVGRTGVVSPVGELDPVILGGVTVRRATLHNEDHIRSLGLRMGDFVVVKRAGDVIPSIERALVDRRNGSESPIVFPSECPECGSPVRRNEGEAAARCQNPGCSQKKLSQLIHFCSKQGMNIEGLGKKWVEVLWDAGYVRRASDLYDLTLENLLLLERQGEVLAQKLLKNIEKSKQVSLGRFLHALSIPRVGSQMADVLAARLGSLKKIIECSEDELLSIDGVGEGVTASITDFFSHPENLAEIRRLLEKGVSPQFKPPEKRKHLPFEGKTFVVTGELGLGSRSQVKEWIESRGGRVVSSLSSVVTYLVAGDHPGSKLQRARELGIYILDEKRLLEMDKPEM